jgi:hypothetical protein
MRIPEIFDEKHFDFISSWWFILLILNAFVGIVMLELTWKSLTRFRNPPSAELNDLFPAFRRNDATQWSKWKLYPGAIFLMVPRFLVLIVVLMFAVFFVKIFLICHDTNKPLMGCRKFLVNATFYIAARLIGVFSFFTWHSYRYIGENEVDYSEYLGHNELQPVASSLGGLMKDFYSRPQEHSSRLIREQSGLNFVSMGS